MYGEDECGVCNGDNSSCADCAGVPNGGAVDLGCGCGDPGPSGCDNACGSTLENDECGVCGGNNDCVDCAGVPGGGAVDLGCGCGDPGPSGCDNACGSTLEDDACGVCGGDGSDDVGCGCYQPAPSGCDNACNSTAEVDCAGVCGGSAEVDECGVCGGDGIADGACDCEGNVEDCAGVCGGDGSSCVEDCNCALYSENSGYDECGVCCGTGLNSCCLLDHPTCDAAAGRCVWRSSVDGCRSVWPGCDGGGDECCDENGLNLNSGTDYCCQHLSGVALICDCDGNINDECGVCGGDSSNSTECGCDDIPDGECDCDGNTLDDCGVCNGDNSTCLDCAGVPNGPAVVDECGECGGDGIADGTCDCEGNVDLGCGCGGDGSSCVVLDIDENPYDPIQIGDQVWLKQNLKVTHYNDGSEILNITNDGEWIDITTGAYGNYNNASSNGETYGRLYNGFVVDDERGVCPEGFHIPTDDEWTMLITYLAPDGEEENDDDNTIAGGMMKEVGLEHWNSPNEGATNESGFTALGGGIRSGETGDYFSRHYYGNFWSSTEEDETYWARMMMYNTSFVQRIFIYDNSWGLSIRCVKDIVTSQCTFTTIDDASQCVANLIINPLSDEYDCTDQIEYQNEFDCETFISTGATCDTHLGDIFGNDVNPDLCVNCLLGDICRTSCPEFCGIGS
jgi:uncharacterized protein (TIGR02145 family)